MNFSTPSISYWAEAVAGRLLPPELMTVVGICLRQARTARCLSITQAADRIGIQPERLEAIENGKEQITNIEAQAMIARYGGARGDRLDSLLYEWAMSEMGRESKTTRRKHLSLVGDDTRPWEKARKNWK